MLCNVVIQVTQWGKPATNERAVRDALGDAFWLGHEYRGNLEMITDGEWYVDLPDEAEEILECEERWEWSDHEFSISAELY